MRDAYNVAKSVSYDTKFFNLRIPEKKSMSSKSRN